MPIKSKKNTTNIKKQISNYILKKGDICCEEDFERKKLLIVYLVYIKKIIKKHI